MTDEQTITEAIDLAEQLVDEVTRADQDWEAVEHLADALARLAAGAAAGSARPTGPRRRR